MGKRPVWEIDEEQLRFYISAVPLRAFESSKPNGSADWRRIRASATSSSSVGACAAIGPLWVFLPPPNNWSFFVVLADASAGHPGPKDAL